MGSSLVCVQQFALKERNSVYNNKNNKNKAHEGPYLTHAPNIALLDIVGEDDFSILHRNDTHRTVGLDFKGLVVGTILFGLHTQIEYTLKKK
jgi:hypothetical protein